MELTLDLIEAVRPAVSTATRRTPILRSDWLSQEVGYEVFFKCESLQVTGSFKVRGAIAALDRLGADERRQGVVTSSAGSHGVGLALAAAAFGARCTVVVPQNTPKVKREAIAARGAKVIEAPSSGYDATQEWTLARVDELGGRFISPFDDPVIMAGNGGTTALEIVEDLPDLDTLIVPCGGGGLTSGAAVAIKDKAPGTRIVAVNPSASPAMWRSLREGRALLAIESEPTIAEGLEGGVSERSYDYVRRFVDEVIVVQESTMRRAVAEIAMRDRLIVEGSAAVGVAALLERQVDAKRACIVLTGSNIDSTRLVALIDEATGASGDA